MCSMFNVVSDVCGCLSSSPTNEVQSRRVRLHVGSMFNIVSDKRDAKRDVWVGTSVRRLKLPPKNVA